MKRRPVSPFSLSFLDIMFCGFGAVVLLVLILNNDTVQARNAVFADLRSEVVKLEREVIVGREGLVTAHNSLDQVDQELVTVQGEAERVIETIKALEIENFKGIGERQRIEADLNKSLKQPPMVRSFMLGAEYLSEVFDEVVQESETS